MEDKMMIPYVAHEGAMTRMERLTKRLVAAVVIVAVMLFASNALWLWAWCQYDYESSEVTVDGKEGTANYIGNDGDINNGQDSSKKKETQKEKR